ncbi:uncharacterized protein LOC135481041 [Liolophura sinensis]|uniref:uncharacterized protein LOC135481041 n=1 Tax=Liolophura sinensis TaxID=3198878 RepID=UPI00315994D8
MATVCCDDSEESAEKLRKMNMDRSWAVAELVLPFSFSEFPVNCQTEDISVASSDCYVIVDCDSSDMKDESTEAMKTMETSIGGKKSGISELAMSTVQPRGDNLVEPNVERDADPFEYFQALPKKTFSVGNYIVSKRKQKLEKRKLRKVNASGKRKWRQVPVEEIGMNPSLFPRFQFKPSEKDRKVNSEAISYEVNEEFMHVENIISNAKDLECFLAIGVKDIRADRHRKIKRAHKQVKDKYCNNVLNNNGKKLFVNHRVYKRMELKPQTIHFLPKQKVGGRSDLEEKRMIIQKEKGKRNPNIKGEGAFEDAKPAPPVASETRHALHSQNAPSTFAEDQALVNLLISLQHRDLSPEDYDLLLRLDEQVAPKTVSKNLLSSFKTDNACEADCCQRCAVCMENYVQGQVRKFLPCQHVFHANCIDIWLENSSLNCPLDGLPVT